MILSRSLAAVAGLVLFVGLADVALAFDNDPALHRLCYRDAAERQDKPCQENPMTREVGDSAAFQNIAREYAVALAPTLLAPAETLGVNGFQFDLQFSVTSINADQPHWQLGIEDTSPPDAFVVSRIGVRKGLPASFEIGMNTNYLIESELWMFGTYLKWGIHEGMDAVPVDFAVRGTYSTLVGSTELDTSVVGLDVLLSKSVGVAGVVNISPYVAYSPIWITSASEVLDSTPGKFDSPEGDFVFSEELQIVHRLTVGSRFVMGTFSLAGEAAITEEQQTYSVNLGIDF